MKVRRIDANNDWTFGRGRANYANGSESVAQRVKTRLQSFKGDWFLDLEHGLPWLPNMERPASLERIETDIRAVILNTDGVSEITALELLLSEDRTLTVNVSIKDIYDNNTTLQV